MITLVSKQVTALRGEPMIHHHHFNKIQEWLNGVNPLGPEVKEHDSGKPREVFPDPSPAGRAETGGPGDTLSHDDLSSGYDKGLDPGGRADDETGPGNSSNPDPEQTFQDGMNSELAFLDPDDFSNPLNPMNFESNKKDKNPTNRSMALHRRPPENPRSRPRTFQRPRSKAAWTHAYGTV